MTTALQQKPSYSGPVAHECGTPEEQQAIDASHLAHDARNRLTVLRVYCDLLRSSGTVAGHGRVWIDELSNAVERGHGLVTSLLASAQNSASLEPVLVKKASAGPSALDLASVIQSREPLFRQLAGGTIRVECKIAAHAKTTALEEVEFDRILLNLVRNAIDAMPRGGRLTIELEQADASQEHLLVLRVSDTGKGIAAEILPSIFESGFSTKATNQHAKCGRGYGLAIVRNLTLAAGGSVGVRSRMGHGTCFTIELPAQMAAYSPVVSKRRSNAPAANRVTQTSGRTRRSNNFGAHRKGTRVPC